MKKSLFVLVLIISLLVITPVYAYDKTSPPSNGGTTTISNGVLDVHIEDVIGGAGFGTYTVSTGSGHPNPGQDVLYGGAAGNPWSSYNTVTVFNATVGVRNQYVTSSDGSIVPEAPGYTVWHLDGFNPVFYTPPTPTQVTIQWGPTLEGLGIWQDIEILGTTLADTKVRVTMCVWHMEPTNITYKISLRYEWDLMIDGMDGPWLRTQNPLGPWLGVEQTWSPPTFQFWETTNYPFNLFSMFGSISEPPIAPWPATPPDDFMYTDWFSAYQVAGWYWPTGLTIGGVDSAVLYFWHWPVYEPPIEVCATAYLWPPQLSPPVGGVWSPVNMLQLLAPWIVVALIALAAAAAGSRRLLMKRW